MTTLDQFGVETPDEAEHGAVIVGDYRYYLWRRGNEDGPVLAFVALNPSTADETTDDDTVRKCLHYAERWGYGKLVIGNLFAYRSKHPTDLRQQEDPIGPENEPYLQQIANEADMVVAAWGVGGELQDRGREVYDRLAEDVDWNALGTTQDGHPWHPSRKANDLDPEPFAYGGRS